MYFPHLKVPYFIASLTFLTFCLEANGQDPFIPQPDWNSTRPPFFVVNKQRRFTETARPSLFGRTLPTKEPPKFKESELYCYNCRLDFKSSGYDAKHPCLKSEYLNDSYLAKCNEFDLFCRVDKTEVDGILILLTRECIDSCFYGCRPKSFGISFETCTECCNTTACNYFFPSNTGNLKNGQNSRITGGILLLMAFKGWKRL